MVVVAGFAAGSARAGALAGAGAAGASAGFAATFGASCFAGAGGGAAAGGGASAFAAGAADPPAASICAITLPLETLSPFFTTSDLMTPALVAGTSIVAFSVSMEISGVSTSI